MATPVLSPREAAESNLPGKNTFRKVICLAKTLSAALSKHRQMNMPGETKLGHERENLGKKGSQQENILHVGTLMFRGFQGICHEFFSLFG